MTTLRHANLVKRGTVYTHLGVNSVLPRRQGKAVYNRGGVKAMATNLACRKAATRRTASDSDKQSKQSLVLVAKSREATASAK
jgi:hypothetical protein